MHARKRARIIYSQCIPFPAIAAFEASASPPKSNGAARGSDNRAVSIMIALPATIVAFVDFGFHFRKL